MLDGSNVSHILPLDIDKKYFFIKFDSNNHHEIQLSKIKNHSLELSMKEKRKMKIYRNNTHKAILFEKKATFISIWGYSDVTFGAVVSRNDPYVKIKNFVPLDIINNNMIRPKWIKQQIIDAAGWNPNKRIILIDKNKYDYILNFALDDKNFFHNPIRSNIQTKNTPDKIKENIDIINQIPNCDDSLLEIPTRDMLERGIDEIKELLLVDKKTIEEIVIHLTSGRHILLAGPIGTGKTHLAELIPQLFWKKDGKKYDTQIHTASNEWNVNDVIGGIMPHMKKNRPTYKFQPGCVTETVCKSWENKISDNTEYRGTWLVIDEFNRAEIDKAFGQLFTSLESKKLYIHDERNSSSVKLKIPKDYRIIGTLNTSDKHYLFKLSDALKRRFAYVEIKMPSKNEEELEIYYALSSALKEIPQNLSLINLDESTKKLSSVQTQPELISAIKTAYKILSFIRITKKMGTAILKSIYQTILIGTQISGYNNTILDMALNSNIITQLEKLESIKIEILINFCFNDLHTFFHKKYNGQDDDDRQKYADDFEYYLNYLEIPNSIKLKDNFFKKNISNEDWSNILENWNEQKPDYNNMKDLSMFKNGLEDLKKTFEFL